MKGVGHTLPGRFRYASRYLVLLVDCFLSVVATLLSYVFFHYLVGIDVQPGFLWLMLAESTVLTLVFSFLFKSYDGIIRHTTIIELGRIIYVALCKAVGLYLLAYASVAYVGRFYLAIGIGDFTATVFLLMFMRIVIVRFYHYIATSDKDSANTLIFGISDTTMDLVDRLSGDERYRIRGFLTRKEHEQGYRVMNHPVYYYKTVDDLAGLVGGLRIKNLLFTSYNALQEDQGLVDFSLANKLKLRIAPINETSGSGRAHVREVAIDDLLNREEIQIDFEHVKQEFDRKVVLVTGAAGSIGSELCRQLCRTDFDTLVLFDFAETPMYRIDLELRNSYPDKQIIPWMGDVRNVAVLERVMRYFHPQVIFHAAAYKHVPMMENFPCEAVCDNLMGTRNVADMAVKYNAEKFVMISTDKAVHPSSVMGATKLLSERYVQSLGRAIKSGTKQGRTTFVTTRFGNVLGSNGSVVPLFRQQIAAGGPVTVTHPDVIRYFMTIPEACRLVLEAASMGEGGDVFVFDMGEPVKIADMARRMIRLSGYIPDKEIEVKYVGLRPGEKLYEELLYTKEDVIPTQNSKIFRAKTMQLDFAEVEEQTNRLVSIAESGKKRETVDAMKAVMPDYHSQNSVYADDDAERDEFTATENYPAKGQEPETENDNKNK